MGIAMAYLRVVLSGVAAIFVALLVPLFLLMAPMGVARTVGFGAITATLLGSIVSPWCWLIAVVIFALFFMAGRLGSKVLRVLLFWAPTLAVSTLGFGIFALLTYTWMLLRKG
jgi:hypothetical protein